MSRFIELKGRMNDSLRQDETWAEDLSESLRQEYPFCHANAKTCDGGTCWQVTVIHKKVAPLKDTIVSNIRGHVQGWMHAATGSNGA